VWPGRGGALEEESGFGGITNQGNTCYLNAVLQALYHVPKFRATVLEGAKLRRGFWRRGPRKPKDALAMVFAALDKNETARTRALTRSLGVDPREQQDAQEYLRVLLEHVDASEFAGSATTELAVTDEEASEIGANVSRSKHETFLDVSLELKSTLRAAIEAALEPELLEDKWKTQDHGYRAATRSWRVAALPSTLVLHLKRFQFGPTGVAKMTHPLDFPEHFYDYFRLGEHYRLQSVVLHAGDAARGHYYAFVDPRLDGRWLRFDDERVTPVDFARVRSESMGGTQVAAYILHYVKLDEPPPGFVPPPPPPPPAVQEEEDDDDDVEDAPAEEEEVEEVPEKNETVSEPTANATRGFRGYVRTVRDRFFTARDNNESAPSGEIPDEDPKNASRSSAPA